MRGKRSSAEKIIGILKETEAGIGVQELNAEVEKRGEIGLAGVV